jgi:hypothetical protein
MVLVKHPEHGVRHVPDGEVAALVSAGWVKWPRSREEKEGKGMEWKVSPDQSEPAVVKRGPGRPRKA